MALSDFAILAISSIVAVMEPFSTIAVYATLTKTMSPEKKRKILAKSMRLSFVVLAFFGLTGHLVFQVFNITMAAFQIAGGILLVAVALRMLNPNNKSPSRDGSEDIAIVPLAFPLTAGPGTITAVILFTSKAQNLIETSFIFVAIFVGVLISYLGMRYSQRLFKYLGDEGLKVVTAIMAIIVLAIAIQFIIDGTARAISQIQ
ncbi:MAG: MarC family protein [Candidatus Bathyarchaeota archaeon]|nr:MarC family protein [Candidatus Bathyarchaeota archaeon]